MKLNLKVTNVYERNYNSDKRIIVNQGGTGSSKTYSLAQLFMTLPFEHPGSVFSIVRKSMPALRASAMKDYINLLKQHGLYNKQNHNKTEMKYYLNGCEIEFFGLDQPQKIRSRRRDFLWANEANELSLESFRQLNMRTNKKVFLDFNPSDEFHWIYDHVLTRDDAQLIISTYEDNPFLPEQIINEIERYKEVDENYWKIYGLGKRGASQIRIYPSFSLVDELPGGETIMGLDFGYNHPTALTKVTIKDDEIYAKEIIYESYLTNNDLIAKMNDMNISKQIYIYADSEDPQRIEELRGAGFNVKPAKKGKDSVKAGIDMIKSRKLHLTKDSTNGQKEVRSYSWKTKDDIVLDEPVKLRDDFVDSMRYAVFTHLTSQEEALLEFV